MADADSPAKPKKRIRLGRIFGTLVFLGLVGAGLYGASWFNSQRFFLIVGATEVRIRKGKMLPYGHDKFVPKDPSLRKAYDSFPLPGGMKMPRGETTYMDRVQLDQAVYRMLQDAAEYTLTLDNDRTPELATKYLEQMRALPGLNHDQQMAIAKLSRDSSYVEARALLARTEKDLARAAELFRLSAKGGGGRYADGEARAQAVERSVALLKTGVVPAPPPAAPPATAATPTPPPAAPPPPPADPTLDPIKALTATTGAEASP